MPTMSLRVTGTSARSRCSTQSKPFSFGERAQPGAPITGLPASEPMRSRLPGSTGMPKCSTRPPAASIAAGITSRRSAMAEAPKTTINSASDAPSATSSCVSAPASCGTRASRTMAASAGASRSPSTSSVFLTTEGLSPGSSVETTATRRRT